MSPAPRRKTAAFEKVGAAVRAVAANAPSRERREKLALVVFVMRAPVPWSPWITCRVDATLCAACHLFPQMRELYRTNRVNPEPPFWRKGHDQGQMRGFLPKLRPIVAILPRRAFLATLAASGKIVSGQAQSLEY
jgi:hypothetical protein